MDGGSARPGGHYGHIAAWVVALVTMLVWLVLVPRLRRHVIHVGPEEAAVSHRLPWRSGTAWWVTTVSLMKK